MNITFTAEFISMFILIIFLTNITFTCVSYIIMHSGVFVMYFYIIFTCVLYIIKPSNGSGYRYVFIDYVSTVED